MRIGFDVSQTCTSRAGCAWHADSLAKSLAKLLGPDNLVLYHHFGSWINGSTAEGTTIQGCENPLFGVSFEEAKRIWSKIERGEKSLPGKPDLVHSNSYMAPNLGRTPLVYTIHDLCFVTHPQYTTKENQQFCSNEFEKALQHADAFHFISKTTFEDFNRLYPDYLRASRKPFRIIHSGPRLGSSVHQQANSDSNSPWLFVGTIEPRKNIEGLLDAFEAYLNRSTHPRPLVIAGNNGWMSARLHERFKTLTNQGMFRYLGQVSDSELDLLYKSSFAFLFPSHYEGFGLPVIEAMNYSLPVISNNIKSIQEFASGAAIFVEMEDTNFVVSKMIALESDSVYYHRKADESKIAAESFNWTSTAERLIELYIATLDYNKNPSNKDRRKRALPEIDHTKHR